MSSWREVAEAVQYRRSVLGLTQPEAVNRSGGLVSAAVWSIIENARQDQYRTRTLIGVARALDWPPDAIKRILAGEDPAGFDPPPDDPEPAAPLQLAALSGKIHELSDKDRQYVESLVDRLLEEDT